ncbi:MAG: hypothetical protein JST83_00580 [Bacteroidetes bacterium]|nr:hypothetical protein [Bacteroidota bacterium]
MQMFADQMLPVLYCAQCVVLLGAICTYRYYAGLVHILSDKDGKRPALWGCLLFILLFFLFLFLRLNTLHVAPIMNYLPIVDGALIAALLLIALPAMRQERHPIMVGAGMVLYMGLLGYLCIGAANGVFDLAKARKYKVQVMGHHRTSGKSRSNYYLHLSPWGPVTDSSQVSVSRDLYNRILIGDSVLVDLHPGALGMQWYEVSR